jgi:hypothetical protein
MLIDILFLRHVFARLLSCLCNSIRTISQTQPAKDGAHIMTDTVITTYNSPLKGVRGMDIFWEKCQALEQELRGVKRLVDILEKENAILVRRLEQLSGAS